MARRGSQYSFAKRQKELKRLKKREEKLLRRHGKADESEAEDGAATADADGEADRDDEEPRGGPAADDRPADDENEPERRAGAAD